MKRLYLQYQLMSSSLAAILDLQAELAARYPAARPVEAAQLHVTLTHFGILDVVYQELRVAQPALSYEDFRHQVERFVTTAEPDLPATATLTVSGFALFGDRHDVLVLELQPSHALIAAHARALQALQTCLEACGLTDVTAFMAMNHNFQHALTFRPHLTLLKRTAALPTFKPELKNLQLAAMPTRYD